jgi:predicted nucleotidyltransferase
MRCGSPEETRVLRWVSEKARELVAAKRVILFGSRARGDAEDRSDFDLAVETEQPQRLGELKELLEENPLTLLAFDVVCLSEVSPAFRERILREGKDITTL